MSTRSLRLPTLCCLAALLAGCPAALRFGPEGELTDPEIVLRKLDERAARVSSLKGEAKARVRTPEQSGSVGQFVAARRPGSLHLETLDFFGKPVAAMATDGKEFQLYDAQTNTFYFGPATAENLARLLPLPLEPEEAVLLLLGDVPRIRAEATKLELDRDARAYRLTLQRGGVTQTLWVGTQDLRPLRSEVRGERAYDVRYSDYQLFEEVVFPTVIELTGVQADGRPTGVELELRYKDLELGARLDDALFMLELPEGARIVDVGPDGPPPGEENGR